MCTINKDELKNILKKHRAWANSEVDGVQANLSGADLREADLREADLRRANLSGAILYRADLGYADLSGADLREADLGYADLRRAYLSGADLSGADLREVDLREADLRGAYLREAYLSGADLSGADLRGADLSGAHLSGADLSGAKINFPIVCPEEGSFIGFKKCRDNLIVKLEITEDSLRCSATGRKCRCSKARVLSITNIDGTDSNISSISSKYDNSFIYKVGETVKVADFDTNRWNECAPGIHFFITRQEAVDY